MMILVSPNNMAVARSSCKVVDDFKAKLRIYFKMTDEGEIHLLLGVEIVRDRKGRTVAINQKAYIKSMANKFGQGNA
jgi:hypothetical protein